MGRKSRHSRLLTSPHYQALDLFNELVHFLRAKDISACHSVLSYLRTRPALRSRAFARRTKYSNATVLHIAAAYNEDIHIMEELANFMMDNDMLDERCGENGWSACQWALWQGKLTNLAALVERGAKGVLDLEGYDMWDLWRMKWGAHTAPVCSSAYFLELEKKCWSFVVGWGSNVDYQLGFARSGTDMECRVIRGPWELDCVDIKNVVTAEKHTLVLDCGGRVFSFGLGKSGRLGLGDEDTQVEPAFVPMSHRVTEIAASGSRSAAITDAGAVFIWGGGILRPQKLPLPNGELAGDIALADGWLLVVTKGHKVFGYGDNSHGQLMLDETVEEALTLRQLPALDAKGISRVFVGSGIGPQSLCCALGSEPLDVSFGKGLLSVYTLFVWGGFLGRRPKVVRYPGKKGRLPRPAVKDVVLGDSFIVVLTIDGYLWGCSVTESRVLSLLQREVAAVSAYGIRFAVVKSLGACYTYKWTQRRRRPHLLQGARRMHTMSLHEQHGVGLVLPCTLKHAASRNHKKTQESTAPTLVTMCEDIIVRRHLHFQNVQQVACVAGTYSIDGLLQSCLDLLIPNLDICVALHGAKTTFDMLGAECISALESRLVGDAKCYSNSHNSDKKKERAVPRCVRQWAYAFGSNASVAQETGEQVRAHLRKKCSLATLSPSEAAYAQTDATFSLAKNLNSDQVLRNSNKDNNRGTRVTNVRLTAELGTAYSPVVPHGKGQSSNPQNTPSTSTKPNKNLTWPTLVACDSTPSVVMAVNQHSPKKGRRKRKQSIMTLGSLPRSSNHPPKPEESPKRTLQNENAGRWPRAVPQKLELRRSLRRDERMRDKGASFQEIQREQELESGRSEKSSKTPATRRDAHMSPTSAQKHSPTSIRMADFIGSVDAAARGRSPPRSGSCFAWHPCPVDSQSPPSPRQSLWDIMKSEENAVGTSPPRLTRAPQCGSSPRRSWNFLPGDGPAHGKNLKLIEAEELAMQSLRNQFPGVHVYLGREKNEKPS